MSDRESGAVAFQLSSVLAEVNGGRRLVEIPLDEATPFSRVLTRLFELEPTLRPHFVDDENRIREHVLLLHNGTNHRYRDGDFEVRPGDEFVVHQAVSGG